MLKFGKNYCVIAAAMMGNLCLLFITKAEHNHFIINRICWCWLGVEIFELKMIQFNVNQSKAHRMPNYEYFEWIWFILLESKKFAILRLLLTAAMAKHTHMRAAEIVMMMDTNSALFPLYYDNAPAVDQTISQTKRDANYTSVLHCNWVCVRVRNLKRQNNCTKPKCCVQQCILTVIFV